MVDYSYRSRNPSNLPHFFMRWQSMASKDVEHNGKMFCFSNSRFTKLTTRGRKPNLEYVLHMITMILLISYMYLTSCYHNTRTILRTIHRAIKLNHWSWESQRRIQHFTIYDIQYLSIQFLEYVIWKIQKVRKYCNHRPHEIYTNVQGVSTPSHFQPVAGISQYRTTVKISLTAQCDVGRDVDLLFVNIWIFCWHVRSQFFGCFFWIYIWDYFLF